MVDEENKEIKEEEKVEETSSEDYGDMKKSFKKKLEKKDEEIEALKAEKEHWKNEYFRAYADTQNLRKTLQKDHQEALKYRAEGFIDSLLPVLDSFFLALETKPSTPEVANYLVGFQYIYKNLVSALESEGVKEIDPKVGDKFDSDTMNALESIEDDGEENIVKKVFSRGYMLHNRIIRPASVLVSVHHKKEENNEESRNA